MNTGIAVSKGRGANLNKAKASKNDEFYTNISDIEKELMHYENHFKGKSVFLNCDDPKKSKFWIYFRNNFERLGLKKLVATHYDEGKDVSYGLSFNGRRETQFKLVGDGDFRSPACVKLLKKADIVVTNPPFSLFREYVAQLMTYEKKFLIIGSMNAVTYKEIFKHIQGNKLWLGTTTPKKFIKPDGSIQNFGNINWFTNLTHKKRNEGLNLYKEYNETDYPKYDEYDAIEVSKVSDIPKDYFGEMGVPITFLDKYCPNQFEIVGTDRQLAEKFLGRVTRFHINGAELYSRLIIKRK